jgi:pimeloyl-ACP methyl ester carboxylesterase
MTLLRPTPKVPASRQAVTSTKPRTRLRRRIGRAVLIGLAVLICVAGAGMGYQAIGAALDRRSSAPAGRLIDVDGHLMHLHCTGVGSPTVVLESGAGPTSPVWGWVQPAVAQHTRVCSYDRAGAGWSDPVPASRDAVRIAAELRTLLRLAGESGPFVIAGHSVGGQYAHMFAEHYQPDTAGLVLIDALHPDMMSRLPGGQAIEAQQQHQISLLIVLSRLGIVRLLNLAPADPRLPAEAQRALTVTKNSTDGAIAMKEEMQAVSTNRSQAQAAGDLGSLPLRVLSATKHGTPELEAHTLGLQRELAALSTDSEHTVVDGADHTSLVTDQHGARPTIAAILDLVERVRQR